MTEFTIGQKIVIIMKHDSLGPPYKIEEITRLTPTQITTSDGRRYLKSTHREVGRSLLYGWEIAFNYFSNYGLMTIEEALKANKEWEEENKIALMRNFIRGVTWKEVPAAKIEQIYKILKGE